MTSAPHAPAVLVPQQQPRRIARSVAQQLAFAFATLLLISVITFAATASKSSEEVAVHALGNEVSKEQIDLYIHEHGLDDPLPLRYVRWLGDFARGHWGTSLVTQRAVRPDVLDRLSKTLILAFSALAVGIPVALSAGVFMARRAGKLPDVVLLILSVILSAMPEFVLGIGLLVLLGVWLGLLPVDNSALAFGTTWEQVKTYVLPVLTLALVALPYTMRITRAAARESLAAPFTQAALLRGLSRRVVLWDHAMRNAAAPIVNAIALNLIYLLGGVIVVENVFGIPGIGSRLVDAVHQGDTPTVQAITLLMGAMFISIAFVVDLLVIYFNPRLRRA